MDTVTALTGLALLLAAATLVLVISLWRRPRTDQALADRIAALETAAGNLAAAQDRVERAVRGEFANARNESAERGRLLREEIGAGDRAFQKTMFEQMSALARQQREQFESFAGQLRTSAAEAEQRQTAMAGKLDATLTSLTETLGAKFAAMNAEQAAAGAALKLELGDSLARFGAQMRDQMTQLFTIQAGQHEGLTKKIDAMQEANDRGNEALRQIVADQFTTLRAENEQKLEQMRQTVDEKLQGTLEKRLGESFKLVSERLEAVHKGLGEVQTLATGVGDLKRVLSNVKTRGTWGEVALGNLLTEMLTPEQFIANAQVKENSSERVEFAIRLPSNRDDDAEVLLPIDAKFPTEDYERIQHAAEAGDAEAAEAARRALEARIRSVARDIAGKYVNPPRTTDFAIMFLPTEGLFLEVIRRPGLCDELRRQHRISVLGPTNLTAVLYMLQMAFRTLAVQKRSSEVWQVLGAVKAEFDKFGPVLDKVRKKLQEATNTIDDAGRRERAIKRRLRNVEALPAPDAAAVIGLAAGLIDDEAEADGEAAA